VEVASVGKVVVRVERWFEESIMDIWERFERAWRERRREWVVWVRDCGSEAVRDERGRVVSRFRYVDVVVSLEEGGGRGEGVSK
jgi:hypothetical protein